MVDARLVVHVVIDDMGREQHGRYGLNGPTPGLPITTFLDQVADGGVRFTNYYGEAFCSPSRADHLAGRHTEDHGVGNIIEDDIENPLLESELTLPEVLKHCYGDDIVNACLGKWHLGTALVGGDNAPRLAGFDYWCGTERNIPNYYTSQLIVQGERIDVNGQYIPEMLTNYAVSWIRRFASDPRRRRGYLYVPMHLPHEPFERPPSYLYNDVAWHCAEQHPTDQVGPGIIPYFKASIEALDRLIRRIWEAIPANLQAETALLISSDNGTASIAAQAETFPDGVPFPSGTVKRSYFDNGWRLPCYAYGGVVASPGRTNASILQSLDWYATTLALFNAPSWQAVVEKFAPSGRSPLQLSVNASKTITATQLSERVYAYGGIFSPNGYNAGTVSGRRAITDGSYKLLFTGGPATMAPTFYDLLADYRELAPVASPTTFQAAQKARLLQAWTDFYADLVAQTGPAPD